MALELLICIDLVWSYDCSLVDSDGDTLEHPWRRAGMLLLLLLFLFKSTKTARFDLPRESSVILRLLCPPSGAESKIGWDRRRGSTAEKRTDEISGMHRGTGFNKKGCQVSHDISTGVMGPPFLFA